MNVRNVLKVYSLLRQFSDDEAALLQTLRSLTEAEQQQMMEALGPPVKRKVAKRASKSPRASGMAQQLNKNLAQQREAALKDITGGDESYQQVTGGVSGCAECQWPASHNIHHLVTDENYHEFRPVQAAGATGD